MLTVTKISFKSQPFRQWYGSNYTHRADLRAAKLLLFDYLSDREKPGGELPVKD